MGGNSKVLMVVNLSPTQADAGESLCSLNFAARVRGVKLGPAVRNVEDGAQIRQLKAEVEALRAEVWPRASCCKACNVCPVTLVVKCMTCMPRKRRAYYISKRGIVPH